MPRPDDTVAVSLRLPAELNDALERVAKALGHERDWVMQRALRSYFQAEGMDVLREAEGLAELDRGEARDFDEAMGEIDEIVARAEARQRTTAR